MSFEESQDGCGSHLGYQKRMILAILNLYVTVMPPIKFRLNPSYCFEGDVNWRISRWQPSWIVERNNFSNSESPCCHNAFHQVSAQTILWFWRRCWKCEKLTRDGWWTDGPWTTGQAPGELINSTIYRQRTKPITDVYSRETIYNQKSNGLSPMHLPICTPTYETEQNIN